MPRGWCLPVPLLPGRPNLQQVFSQCLYRQRSCYVAGRLFLGFRHVRTAQLRISDQTGQSFRNNWTVVSEQSGQSFRSYVDTFRAWSETGVHVHRNPHPAFQGKPTACLSPCQNAIDLRDALRAFRRRCSVVFPFGFCPTCQCGMADISWGWKRVGSVGSWGRRRISAASKFFASHLDPTLSPVLVTREMQ